MRGTVCNLYEGTLFTENLHFHHLKKVIETQNLCLTQNSNMNKKEMI